MEVSALTANSVVPGSPAFMAPEQALSPSAVDNRADVYSVGCVAYWLLTGQAVFTADTTLGLLMHHIQTTPPPPSSRTELPVPEALDQVVLACLAKDPAGRPQTAKDLSHRLAAIPVPEPWTQDRARSWWAQHEPAAAGRVFAHASARPGDSAGGDRPSNR